MIEVVQVVFDVIAAMWSRGRKSNLAVLLRGVANSPTDSQSGSACGTASSAQPKQTKQPCQTVCMCRTAYQRVCAFVPTAHYTGHAVSEVWVNSTLLRIVYTPLPGDPSRLLQLPVAAPFICPLSPCRHTSRHLWCHKAALKALATSWLHSASLSPSPPSPHSSSSSRAPHTSTTHSSQ